LGTGHRPEVTGWRSPAGAHRLEVTRWMSTAGGHPLDVNGWRSPTKGHVPIIFAELFSVTPVPESPVSICDNSSATFSDNGWLVSHSNFGNSKYSNNLQCSIQLPHQNKRYLLVSAWISVSTLCSDSIQDSFIKPLIALIPCGKEAVYYRQES